MSRKSPWLQSQIQFSYVVWYSISLQKYNFVIPLMLIVFI